MNTYTSERGTIDWNVDRDGEVELEIEADDGYTMHKYLTRADIHRMFRELVRWDQDQTRDRVTGEKR